MVERKLSPTRSGRWRAISAHDHVVGGLGVGLVEHHALVAGPLEHRGERHDADGREAHDLDAAVLRRAAWKGSRRTAGRGRGRGRPSWTCADAPIFLNRSQRQYRPRGAQVKGANPRRRPAGVGPETSEVAAVQLAVQHFDHRCESSTRGWSRLTFPRRALFRRSMR